VTCNGGGPRPRTTSRDGDAHTATLTVENHCMSNVFEIRDPDTGAVIERVERKDMPPAARQRWRRASKGCSTAVKSCLRASGTRRASPFTGA